MEVANGQPLPEPVPSIRQRDEGGLTYPQPPSRATGRGSKSRDVQLWLALLLRRWSGHHGRWWRWAGVGRDGWGATWMCPAVAPSQWRLPAAGGMLKTTKPDRHVRQKLGKQVAPRPTRCRAYP